MASIDYSIEQFNNGNVSIIERLFGSTELFIKFIKKKNRLHDLRPDPSDLYASDYNHLMKSIFDSSTTEQKKPLVDHIIDQYISDVEKIDDNTYRFRFDREDLSNLFRDYSRDTSPRDVAQSVLNEDYWEPFDSVIDRNNMYDLIEDLNDDNMNYVIGYIVSHYKTLDLSDIETGLSEELKERLESSTITLTPEITKEILEDEELTKELFNTEWQDLYWELSGAYTDAYNDTYTSEIYNKVMSELDSLFGNRIKWKNDNKRFDSYVDLSYSTIYQFLYDYLEGGDDETYYYQGNLESILKELHNNSYDWLDFRIPDYPDYTDIKNNYQETIQGRI
jgi:hypothetical protein